MGLRIATNIGSLQIQRNLEKNISESTDSYARLSSGQRITHAKDDAAGLAIGSRLEAEVRGLRQAQRNANDGVSFAQTAEGALNEVSNILIRLRELGVQSASDTLGEAERGFVDKEYQTLKSEIDRIAQVTVYNGKALLNGSSETLQFQVGAHDSEDNRITFHAGDADSSTSELGIDSSSVSDQDSARDSLESIDSALNKVNQYRANLGALQNRLHSASSSLGIYVENITESKSRITDTDIAAEVSKLVQKNIVTNAGIAVLAQANSAQSQALKLL